MRTSSLFSIRLLRILNSAEIKIIILNGCKFNSYLLGMYSQIMCDISLHIVEKVPREGRTPNGLIRSSST